jgi:hypothetical protein
MLVVRDAGVICGMVVFDIEVATGLVVFVTNIVEEVEVGSAGTRRGLDKLFVGYRLETSQMARSRVEHWARKRLVDIRSRARGHLKSIMRNRLASSPLPSDYEDAMKCDAHDRSTFALT